MAIKAIPEAKFYFVSIQLNASALISYRETLERYIQQLPTEVPGWVNPGSPNAQLMLFHDGLMKSLLPITLRSSFLVAAWSLYESTVLEIAAFLSSKLELSQLSTRRGGFFQATAAYYQNTLGFPRDNSGEVTRRLHELYRLRNAIAHNGGRKGATRDADWQKIVELADARGDFETKRGMIEPSEELIYEVSYLIQDAVDHLVSNARTRLVQPT